MTTAVFPSPIGNILLAARDDALVGLWLEGQKYYPEDFPEPVPPDSEILQQTVCWLNRYFAGQQPSPAELRLAPRGTDFQRHIWQLLTEIPYGQTTTYGALTARLGKGPMTARAVGSAVSRNPISIIIPCHRVLGADGTLTGYAGGLERKKWLLEFEAAVR